MDSRSAAGGPGRMGRGFGSEQTKGWWVVGDDMYQVHIEEIALTSLRMQGLEEENERLKAELAGVIEGHAASVALWQQQDFDNQANIAQLKARVAELEERLFHMEGRGKNDLEKRIDAFLEKHLPQLDELE